MIVYLDLLILDNFCADAALLYCAVRTVKGEVRWLRIALTAALGAALGTGYAVFTLYYTLPAAVGFIVRWGVLFVLPLPAASFKYKRTYLLCSLAFVGYMAAFAGILTALFARGEPGTAGGELTYTVGGIPSGVLVAGCVAFAFAAEHFVRRLTARAEIISCTCRCTLRLGAFRLGEAELTMEIRLLDEDTEFINQLSQMDGVDSAVLVSYNGDYMG